MPKITDFDKNFKSDVIKADDVVFYNCKEEPFEIRGLFEPKKSERFSRLPEYFANSAEVNDGVRYLMYNTAGARVRFVTNSPFIAIVADVGYKPQMQHMPGTCEFGFDMYVATENDRTNTIYKKTFVPNGLSEENHKFEGFYEFDDSVFREITINFPLYEGVNSLYIGLKENAQVKSPAPYTIDTPVVYYGSSITQGGCASRPGTVYTALCSRWLDSDHINLGFSGSDLGEKQIAEFIAEIPMSAFVYAYGANAPTLEHFENTYYPFYKIIRDKNPDLPFIFMSTPTSINIKNEKIRKSRTARRAVVMKTYLRAMDEGDENVYFIDGFTTLGNSESEDATVDGGHPTDLGFYNMAKSVYPVLKGILKNRKS